MNNYAYLIKAKAKATDSKNLFCWFPAKSDSRAERKILDILEDAEIDVGRGADHQLPIRTNWHIVDDLPDEGILDETWCDRYELGGEDGLTWQKIAAPVVEEATEAAETEDATNAVESDEEYANDENALFSVATMPFRTQLLAQYTAEDRHVYHISPPHRARLSAMEMDVDNHYVQNMILAAENIPDIKSYDMPGLWKFTNACKKAFPEDKRHELGKLIQFAKLWFETNSIDRGILTKEWASGNCITSVQRTDSGTNAGGGNKTDRNPDYDHTLDTLDQEIALATLPMDFDIYDFPASIHRRAKEIIAAKESPWKEWSVALRSVPGILDYSRAAIFAMIRGAGDNVHHFPDSLRRYINSCLTESVHDKPSAETIAAARHSPKNDSDEEVGRQLAASRGEYVEGISDPNNPKWVHEDLTKPKKPEIAKVSPGMYSIENLMGNSPVTPLSIVDQVRQHSVDEKIKIINNEETTSHVQMEEAINDEAAAADEISKSETADETTAGDAKSGNEANTLNNDSGHHNIEEPRADYVHVMVDLETMGKKSDAPIVSIGAVIFDPETGFLGETFYKVVSLESAVSWGAEIDPSTVIWWMKQSSEARSEIANDNAIQLDDALLQFSEFVFENIPGGCETAQIWGNGATFDNTILRSSFERACLECPWDYRNDRDVRTMVELGKAIGFDAKTSIPFEGERHNALADAQHQARYVSAIWQRLIKN
ncbi:3'-5' exoribonuclease [Klebsiella pasteurii]|uniref:exonuclease n=1 Tax=Klebsiella TaxID=570 RepID=UPI0015EB0512|nr:MULTISPECIES: exonuclease [Klebsiella]ELI8806791.1 3'-5' exoribonuclease [Klebsiella michiganensis]MDS7872571.1 3'-5' exoribonuclease [Klebsiella pasteurii]QMR69432.1 3'-5' exoribonuclease [Klebsiella grimontii]WDC41103.1 3'-5' exoribonuclease [Klebsiella grimontii]